MANNRKIYIQEKEDFTYYNLTPMPNDVGAYELQRTVILSVGHTLTFTDEMTFTPRYGDDVTFKLSAS